MRITDMLSERPMADLYVKISSPLKSLLEVINTEPLALLKKYDFDIDHAEGAVLATLKMGFPLLKDVEFKDFDLGVEAHLEKAYIKKLTPQHPFVLSEGTYDLTIKSDELTMTGHTLLNGLPADFTWHSYFYPKRTYKNHYLFKCTAKLNEIPETDLSAYDQYVPGLIGFDLAIKELVNKKNTSPRLIYISFFDNIQFCCFALSYFLNFKSRLQFLCYRLRLLIRTSHPSGSRL
jgi:hypothetical protein